MTDNNDLKINEKNDLPSMIIDNKTDRLAPKNIVKEMSESFIEYAMSVIISRALPDVRDGLKPVHRRIIYSMNESGFQYGKPHKKCARIVGDVLGKYHPHGDTAVYEALVRMAQDFSMRYPLVDGHGNFGSVDGDSAAAMRYTEARLSKIADLLVSDIDKKTVEFVDNYDASEREPKVLPAKFPNLLVNGSVGIAVGMATNIPPHNLSEVIDALILLANNFEATTADLIEKLPGPDFPTGGIIMGNNEIINAYETGKGIIQVRARGTIETDKTGKNRLIYTEIPYMVNKARLIHKIASLVKEKHISGITNLRDESNRKGMRIVIELRKDVVPEVIQNQLYKLSQLQVSFGMNMLALVNGEPKTLNLKHFLQNYLNFQVEITTKKIKFELGKSQARILILKGLTIAINNIDDVIAIIKQSKSELDAQNKLIEKFSLVEVQAKAITEMRLSRLTGLAQEKMQSEIKELEELIDSLKLILSDPKILIAEIVKNLEKVKEEYSDKRRTLIEKGNFTQIHEEDLIPLKDIIITLTRNGYVRRFLLEEYNIQKRGGVGSRAGTIYEDDEVQNVIITKTHIDLLIFTSLGKVYRIRAYQIPPTTKNSKGTPFINLINIQKDEKVVAIQTAEKYNNPEEYLLTTTIKGIVKRTKLIEYESINVSGKKAVVLSEDDELLDAIIIKGSDELILGSSEGKVVRFHAIDIRPTGRASQGVIGMKLGTGKYNKVVGVCTVSPDQFIFSIGSHGYGKMTPVVDYRKTKRGAKGVNSINTTKSGKLVCIHAVKGTEEAFILNTEGIGIRMSLETVAQSSRNTKGVKIITLKEKQKITSVAIIDIDKIESEVMRAICETRETTITERATQEIMIKSEDFEEKKDSIETYLNNNNENDKNNEE